MYVMAAHIAKAGTVRLTCILTFQLIAFDNFDMKHCNSGKSGGVDNQANFNKYERTR